MGAREFIGHDSQNRSRDGFPGEEKGEPQAINASRGFVTKAKLIITPLDSHRREAFASYPSGAGPLSTESVDEYISILRKEELCLKITPDVEHPAISVVFPLSMQDPGLFKCLLVGAQSLHDWRRDPFHVNRSRTMLKLQNEAILSLRKRLSAPSAHLDDGVLISITHLMIADSCRRDLTSLKSHLKGARQIISLRGGLGITPAHLAIRALLTTVEFYIALGQYLQISLMTRLPSLITKLNTSDIHSLRTSAAMLLPFPLALLKRPFPGI
ncbi:Fungal specific transcription factor domain-containing protein [Cladophialophora immunda]|nr:Fungal specific transcription factor domain-containing protein [Cladophialophora immunda]